MFRSNRTLLVAALTGASFALGACGGGDEEADDAAFEQEPVAEEPAGAQQPAAGAEITLPADAPAGVTQELVAQGRDLFSGQANCYTCHGPEATGTQLAPDLTDGEWLWVEAGTPPDEALQAIHQTIQTGITQPKEYPAPMPAMGGAQLSADQINALAAYVYAIGNTGG